MRLDDTTVGIEIDPSLRCLDETFGDGRMPGHPCLLQCLDRIGQLGLMVVDNVYEPRTSRLDVVDFPTILHAVADLPEGYHRCLSPPNVLCKGLIQPLELCWCQAPAGRLAVFDCALDTVRFGNGDNVRPGRTPVQGHLGQGLVCLSRHLL